MQYRTSMRCCDQRRCDCEERELLDFGLVRMVSEFHRTEVQVLHYSWVVAQCAVASAVSVAFVAFVAFSSNTSRKNVLGSDSAYTMRLDLVEGFALSAGGEN